MKKNVALFLLLLIAVTSFGQKKQRVKGSKIVTVEKKEIGNFDTLEIEDNFEVYLEHGNKNEITIETDDNLHEFITFDLRDKALRIYTSKNAYTYKKLLIKVTYTNDLKKIIVKNEVSLYAVQELQLDDITINSLDYAKLFLNVNSKKFTLQANDKVKAEINLKAENGTFQFSGNSSIKALVNTAEFKTDLYEKATATLEGEVTNGIIRLDNNTTFKGNKLNIKNANLVIENYATCNLLAELTVSIAAGNKTETYLYGTPKIEITKFTEEAKLIKVIK